MNNRLTSVLFASALALLAGSALATSPEDRCEFQKNTIAGKYAFCRQKAEAKAIKKGTAPDFAKCDEKLLSKWARTEAKAINKGTTCIDAVTATEIQSFVTEHAEQVARALDGARLPECGDGSVNAVGEQCDGPDLDGESCGTLAPGSAGTLTCDAGCRFDSTGCEVSISLEEAAAQIPTKCRFYSPTPSDFSLPRTGHEFCAIRSYDFAVFVGSESSWTGLRYSQVLLEGSATIGDIHAALGCSVCPNGAEILCCDH